MTGIRAILKYAFVFFTLLGAPFVQSVLAQGKVVSINLVWDTGAITGKINIRHGDLKTLHLIAGKGVMAGNSFSAAGEQGVGIQVEISSASTDAGPAATIVEVNTGSNSFSFFVRDVSKEYPVYIPAYGAAVLPSNDRRSYHDVRRDVLQRKTLTKIQRIEQEKETTFESAAANTRDMHAPTWLGLSRDMRIFELSKPLPDMGNTIMFNISPRFASSPLRLTVAGVAVADYQYTMGRGTGVMKDITRRLDSGYLPILNTRLTDDDIVYHSTEFVGLEKVPVNQMRGTSFLAAAKNTIGQALVVKESEEIAARDSMDNVITGETILFFRGEFRNMGRVPRYAWFKAPGFGPNPYTNVKYKYNRETGFSTFEDGRVFCISKLNGKPLPNEEFAVLLQPGQVARVEFYLPHSPVSGARAAALSKNVDVDQKLKEVRSFWVNKLNNIASIKVPEQRIDEMMKAGFFHLDLITYGKKDGDILAPSVGIYSPIGTESAPIIQFYLSLGLFEEAKRSLNYFFNNQHENGSLQGYSGYTVETGSVLWTAGEYFRYTRDADWVIKMKDKLMKAANYLIRWRNENKVDSLRGKGYGMVKGKVADPEDNFHQYMLNGYSYLGLKRVAEMFRGIAPGESVRIGEEAATWREDIRTSFFRSRASSPVVPLGDGTWCATVPPWPEAGALRVLYEKPELFWSHGTFTAQDALLSPMYLPFTEVLSPFEPASRSLLDYHSEILYQGDAAFSQPYYSRHNWLQARLGMVKPFLNTYYYTMSALADRDTYTFWEHLFRGSPHKTHEEAWFLMQTRWMLYMESGDTLNLFKTIPVRWMEDGKTIRLQNVASYFGNLDVTAVSHVDDRYITARIAGDFHQKPRIIVVRLPHPQGKRPSMVQGGVYDKETESVVINDFTGEAEIKLLFQ